MTQGEAMKLCEAKGDLRENLGKLDIALHSSAVIVEMTESRQLGELSLSGRQRQCGENAIRHSANHEWQEAMYELYDGFHNYEYASTGERELTINELVYFGTVVTAMCTHLE